MRSLLIILIAIALPFLGSCATKTLTSKVIDPNQDSFKEEAFLRYTTDRLEGLEKTAYGAVSKCHQGDYNEGLKALQITMKENKKNPEYWNQIGMCYFLSENYAKAEFYFELSLNNSRQRFSPALNNIGVLKLKTRHYEDALNYFKKAAKMGRSNNVPLFNQAQVYLQFNLVDQAGPILKELNKKNKTDPDVLFSLGTVYLLKGNTKDSLYLFNKISNSYKKREDVTLVKAIGLYEQKKYYEAKETLDSVNFINHVPLKRSAKKLSELVLREIKRIEAEAAGS